MHFARRQFDIRMEENSIVVPPLLGLAHYFLRQVRPGLIISPTSGQASGWHCFIICGLQTKKQKV